MPHKSPRPRSHPVSKEQPPKRRVPLETLAALSGVNGMSIDEQVLGFAALAGAAPEMQLIAELPLNRQEWIALAAQQGCTLSHLADGSIRFVDLLTHRNAQLAKNEANATPARMRAVETPSDAWENAPPLQRRLLMYMDKREEASLEDLCPVVWEADYDRVSDSSIRTAISRANQFTGKTGRTLEKVRGESKIRWT